MKKIILIAFFALLLAPSLKGQQMAVKTNALGWAAYGTLNAGFEFAVAPRWTIDADVAWNPWQWRDRRSSEMWGVQAEGRYWLCQKFAGHFFGLHAQYGSYDCGMSTYHYDGWLAGAGISYGYALPVAPRWRLEFNLGAGYNRAEYDKTSRRRLPGNVEMFGSHYRNYWGITRAGINVVFIIK